MSHRVVQWGTGNVGTMALRAIIESPQLELVGMIASSPSKIGADAGVVCGTAPVGVIATDDVDAVLALKPDVVSYMASADLRPDAAVADMARALRAGVNVVSTSVVPLIHPKSADRRLVEPLEDACREGGTTFFTSGIDPGYANDLVPLTFCGTCERIDRVRVMEVLDYSTYFQPTVLFETMGFGQPLDSSPLLLLPGVLKLAWGGVVSVLAEGLGVELDSIEEHFIRFPAERTYELDVGTVPEGTQAGLRFEVRGIVGGEPRIVLEHVTRMHPEVAPDWPTLEGQGGYRVVIEGNPSVRVDIITVGADGDHNTGNILGTAMRVLNAIPAVVAAEPGLLSVLDLPLVPGTGLMR
jgi:4-hydroxy-tetrahydrodipicolinate reductase